MTRPRLTLAHLMVVVLCVGFGFAALRNANEFWASTTYSAALVTLALAPVGAIARKGAARASWAGLATFAWTYFIARCPPWPAGDFGFISISRPMAFVEWAITRLQPYVRPVPPGMTGGAAYEYLISYKQIGLSLSIILFGLIGSVLGLLVAPRDDPPDAPGTDGPRAGNST